MKPGEHVYLYTVDEARALIPRLRPLLAALQVERQRMQEEIRKLNELTPAMQQNGHAIEAAEREAMILELGESVREKLDQFEELGIDVKDIERGVIDFPSEREGRIVYLCWQIDEETVSHWHELDHGYRGRRPLDE
jgi:hypothetical protein